ncbi:MAG: RNA methyltransferase [Microcoleaceae cyanobacterium]
MLTSLQNPLIKQIRKLHTAKGRRNQQQFLLEGTHLIESALAVDYPLEVVCYTSSWQAQHQQLCELITQQVNRVELIDERVLQQIATTVNPEGIIATAPRLTTSSDSFFVNQNSNNITHSNPLYLALETIQDPGNLGTIIRTAAAAGVEGLLMSADSVDVDHPKVLRASAGAWFGLPMKVYSDLVSELKTAQQQGFQIIATLPTATKIYWELDFDRPTIILLGNEGAGLSQPLVELSDQQVKVPLHRAVESLNVGICAALILYEAQRQGSYREKGDKHSS